MKFVLSSHNVGKLKEISKILKPLNIEICTPKSLGIDTTEPAETGKTFKENAQIKARYLYNLTKLPTIADDSGLEVDILGGRPGVYSARFAGENSNDQQNRLKLLSALKGVPKNKRTAKFVCYICCIMSDGKEFFTHGTIDGIISSSPIGSQGFGYDSVFIFDGSHTFAQVPSEVKNKISHRAKALNSLYNKLKSYSYTGEL